MPSCFSCGKELDILPEAIGRGSSCDHCGADIRVCYNCKHYDQKSYNECAEPQAERVVDKDRANFCDYYSFAGAQTDEARKQEKADALKKLDDLFK